MSPAHTETAPRHVNEILLTHPVLGEPDTSRASPDQKNHQANISTCKKKVPMSFLFQATKF